MSTAETRRWPAPLIAALLLHAVFALTACFFPPALNSDSATGFLVWDSWQRGGAWNTHTSPDAADIARDTSVFQAWWSPGQYLIVAPWQWLGLNLGQAIAWGGFVASVASVLGFWRLFLDFGFSRATAGWSVLVIACNWTMTRTYGDYMGGETALFAVLPWLVLATRRAVGAGGWSWLALPALYWVGNMAKNSYIPMAAGLIAGLRGTRVWGVPWISAAKLGEVGRWLGWLALGHALLWFTYLRLGANPSALNAGHSHPQWWQAVAQMIGFPVTGVFSLGNMLGRIFQHPSNPRVASAAELWPVHIAGALVAVVLLIWLLRREAVLRPPYARVLGGVLAAYFGFFSLILIIGASAGWEERMFKPVSFLLVPAMVDIVRSDAARWARWLLGGALAAGSLYGVAAVANRARHLGALDNVGRRGVTQHVLSREALRVLHLLDDTLPAGALIVVPSPEMALEFRRTRVMATHATMSTPLEIAAAAQHGRVADLVVVADNGMVERGQAAALRDRFRDYPASDWNHYAVGGWHFFHQGPFKDWPNDAVRR